MRLAFLAFLFSFVLVATESVAAAFHGGFGTWVTMLQDSETSENMARDGRTIDGQLESAVDRLFDSYWMATHKATEEAAIPSLDQGLNRTLAPPGDPSWKTGHNTTGNVRHRSSTNSFKTCPLSVYPKKHSLFLSRSLT